MNKHDFILSNVAAVAVVTYLNALGKYGNGHNVSFQAKHMMCTILEDEGMDAEVIDRIVSWCNVILTSIHERHSHGYNHPVATITHAMKDTLQIYIDQCYDDSIDNMNEEIANIYSTINK